MQSFWQDHLINRKLLKHRFWRKLYSRLGPRYARWNVGDLGFILDVADQGGVSKQILRDGSFEKFNEEVVDAELNKNHFSRGVALDIGANIGYWSVVLSRHLGFGQVYAFEPEPHSYKLLTQNLTLNNLNHVVKTFPIALGEQQGESTLTISTSNQGDHRLGDARETLGSQQVQVKVAPVESLVDLTKVSFIKMDVQGYELHVLKGMRSLLESKQKLMLMIEFWPDGLRRAGSDPKQMLEYLIGLNFSVSWIEKKTRTFRTTTIEEILKLCHDYVEVDLLLIR